MVKFFFMAVSSRKEFSLFVPVAEMAGTGIAGVVEFGRFADVFHFSRAGFCYGKATLKQIGGDKSHPLADRTEADVEQLDLKLANLG